MVRATDNHGFKGFRSIFCTVEEDPTDIDWLREVHCPDLPTDVRSFVLWGNEDSPSWVDCYTDPDPKHTDPPLVSYAPDSED